MGKMKQFPRYNILSLRVSDEVSKSLDKAVKASGQTKSVVAYELLVKALGVEG